MAEPNLVAYSQSTWTDVTSSTSLEVTGSFTWQSGDVFHVFGGTDDTSCTLGLPSTAGSNLTFSQITALSGASACRAYYWRGTATGSGSGTITSSQASPGVASCGLSAFQYRSTDGQGTPVTATGSANKTLSVTRGQANSHVVFAGFDWNAVGDTTVDPTPATNANERVQVTVSGRFDAFVNQWSDQGSTGTTSYGITNHTGTVQMTMLAVEIFGTSSGATGTLAVTLGAATLSAAGNVPIAATASITLGALTLSAAGAIPHTATLDTTLGELTLAATGTVASAGSSTGTLTVTLDALTLASTAQALAQGTLNTTLSAMTLAATGKVSVQGTLGTTLGALTLNATGKAPISGALSTTLDALTLASTAKVTVTGAAAITLGQLTLVAGVGIVTGTANIVLDTLTLNAVGTLPTDQAGWWRPQGSTDGWTADATVTATYTGEASLDDGWIKENPT